jgi:hypothetical protein
MLIDLSIHIGSSFAACNDHQSFPSIKYKQIQGDKDAFSFDMSADNDATSMHSKNQKFSSISKQSATQSFLYGMHEPVGSGIAVILHPASSASTAFGSSMFHQQGACSTMC